MNPRRRSDGERSHSAILDEAARLATVEGIEGLSLARLADAVGMSKSGLFAHFKSKEELQLATVESASSLFAHQVTEPAARARTGLERLRSLADGYLAYLETETFPGLSAVQLRTGLHGYETAVRFLKEQPWPGANLDRAVLNLFYARSLVTYYQAYSWEINRRERVESRYPVDLKVWTRDQIYSEAQKSYTEVWKERLALGREPVTRLAEYLETNNYPKGIRGTLRDAVTYLYVELLADTSLWKPEETGDLYRVDLKALLAAPATAARNMNAEALLNPAIHPLVKIGYLLDDLEAWHAGGRRSEAALEARLERLRRLHDSFTEPRDRALIRADLEQRLPAFRAVPWWAMGKATQAEFVRALDEPGKLIRARAIAEEGWKAYPDSFGGGRCLYIIKSIEAPEFSLTAMLNDGFQKRSVEVSHRNLPALYFRAYPMDLVRRIETAKDYNLLPSPDAQQQILERQRPAAEWPPPLCSLP